MAKFLENSVELHLAFSWDCPNCGREQFTRGVQPEFSPEDLERIRVEKGVDPELCGSFLMQPEKVCCAECEQWFEVEGM